jgi:hypothetical protein
MKKIIALLASIALMTAHTAPATGDGYREAEAVATAADVLTLDNGETIRLYNGDRLTVGETYILLLDDLNDGELLDYTDIETYELNRMR